MEVGGGFKDVDSGCFRVKQEEVFAEFLLKVGPVEEAKLSMLCFVLELPGGPSAGTCRLHVGHSPDDLGSVVTVERFRD